MKNLLRLIASLMIVLGGLAGVMSEASTSISQIRPDGVDYKELANDLLMYKEFNKSGSRNLNNSAANNPDPSLENYGNIKIPEISPEELKIQFELAKNFKGVIWNRNTSFLRRIAFLYPYDGCHTRAAQMDRLWQIAGKTVLPKVFVFGNLEVKSVYTGNKVLKWYFHVAPIARVNNTLMMIDPSLNYNEPMTYSDWLKAMGIGIEKAEARVCGFNTYTPFESCYNSPGEQEISWIKGDIQAYLDAEWDNIVKLNLNPEELLGEKPPWMN